MALIGEQFEESDEICGVVASVRQRQDKLALWTKTATNEAAQVCPYFFFVLCGACTFCWFFYVVLYIVSLACHPRDYCIFSGHTLFIIILSLRLGLFLLANYGPFWDPVWCSWISERCPILCLWKLKFLLWIFWCVVYRLWFTPIFCFLLASFYANLFWTGFLFYSEIGFSDNKVLLNFVRLSKDYCPSCIFSCLFLAYIYLCHQMEIHCMNNMLPLSIAFIRWHLETKFTSISKTKGEEVLGLVMFN